MAVTCHWPWAEGGALESRVRAEAEISLRFSKLFIFAFRNFANCSFYNDFVEKKTFQTCFLQTLSSLIIAIGTKSTKLEAINNSVT